MAGFFSCFSSKKSRSSIKGAFPAQLPAKLNYYTFAEGGEDSEPALFAGRVKVVMPRKKAKKRFSAVTTVKELARERVGRPPSEKIVVEKNKKPEKHKPTLGKLLEESD